MYEFKRDDAFDFARNMSIQTKIKGDELLFNTCPYCRGGHAGKDKGTFSINLITGQFHCLRAGCGVSGNLVTLSKDFDFSLGNMVDEYYKPRKSYKRLKTPVKPIEPKPPAVEYLESRGISKEVAERYEITVQTDNPNILVFPFYDEKGRLQFVKYRKTDFNKEKDKNKEWCEANCKPILFGMKQCKDFKRLIVTEGQCFDGKSEILTPEGWIAFENYSGQDVLQVDDGMNGTFIRPNRVVIKRHIGKMVRCKIGGNYETYTTDDHNLVFIMSSGKVIKKRADEKISTAYKIPTTVKIDSSSYKNWTNEMFALYLAISADGTIDYRKNTGYKKAKSERYVRIAIPLERKAKRLRELLDKLGIEYSSNKNSKNYDSICFSCPDWLKSKYLPYGFATETSVEQKRFIIEEMTKWDGNKVNNRNQYEYTTILKHNADVMQLIATSCGYMSTIMTKQNGGNGAFVKSYCYKVSVLLGKSYVSTQQFEMHKTFEDVDQRVYCVSVDTGMILVRQNGKISVTGNCDSLSVATAGIENAVSVPTGAKGFTWLPYCWNWINQFEELIVFGDYENGKISLLDELSNRLKIPVKHVRDEDYKDCKDANEILKKYGAEQIRKCIDNAVQIQLKQIIELADVKDENPYLVEKLETGIKQFDDLLHGGLPFGGLVLISGKRGEGKSTLASQVLANSIEQGYKSFAYSGELPNRAFKSTIDFQIAGTHIVVKESKAGNQYHAISDVNKKIISDWYRGKCFLFDNSCLDGEETESLVSITENVIMQYGVRVILLDNLMTAIDLETKQTSDKNEMQSLFVKKLARLALKHNVLIILVAHKRKNNFSTDANDEISGSGDISNLASVIISYEKDKDAEQYQRVGKITKNRLFGELELKGYRLDYDFKSKRIYGDGDDVAKEYSWNKSDSGFYSNDIETPFD